MFLLSSGDDGLREKPDVVDELRRRSGWHGMRTVLSCVSPGVCVVT